MFDSKKLDKYADVILWALKTARKNKFKKYDNVLVNFEKDALPLAELVHEKLVSEKINTTVNMLSTAKMSKDFYKFADNIMLKNIPAGKLDFTKKLNGYILLRATEDLLALQNVSPTKITTSAIARKKLRDIMNINEQKGDFGWTLINYPTKNMAKNAGLSLKEYTRQIEKACFLNEKDPVKKWQSVVKKIHNIERWLDSLKIDTIYMQSKNTDLEMKLGANRKFLGGRGANIPSFEIFSSPDYRYTKGIYYADLPSYINGNYVKNLKLEFHNGKVVNLKASVGEEFARKMIFMDEGSCRLGEFSLTDTRFSKIDKFMADTLYDENFGGKNGNSHLALGSSFLDTYTKNPEKLTKTKQKELGYNNSALHWDIINTEKKVVKAKLKGGKIVTIYENGKFKH